ncbi:V-set and transmembrane domain-containing protein 1-like isoform X1 [Leopardus geoffroyi]|uniref:V-set and transmembrane domain-containing protein 1-like isoform X1 n=2 Tax=Leopardus geoffroyi TaxID=46844 RepID=UPI001E25FD5D|nr:V-set and transmembrane domain-containing protein 1-like isoform X1 [Leopardus geoffroyi]
MITEFLSLLCLGLSLGFEDEKKNGEFSCIHLICSCIPSFLSDPLNSGRALAVITWKIQTNSEFFPETLTKPYLSALPSPVVEQGHNVTLRCLGHRHNVTFMLGKLQDSGYRQEQRSAGYEAEFLLTHLEPKDAGTYFCAYKTMDSQEWSEESEHLQLEVTDDRNKRRAPPGGKVTISTIAATCSCLSILLLFLSVFLINRCTQHDLSHEESTERTSHSKLPQQEAMGE